MVVGKDLSNRENSEFFYLTYVQNLSYGCRNSINSSLWKKRFLKERSSLRFSAFLSIKRIYNFLPPYEEDNIG